MLKTFGKTYFRNFKNRSYRSLEKHWWKYKTTILKFATKIQNKFRKYKDILNNLKKLKLCEGKLLNFEKTLEK